MRSLILFWTFKLKHLGLLVWSPYNLLVIVIFILDMWFCNLFISTFQWSSLLATAEQYRYAHSWLTCHRTRNHVALFAHGFCVIHGYCQHSCMWLRLPTTFYLSQCSTKTRKFLAVIDCASLRIVSLAKTEISKLFSQRTTWAITQQFEGRTSHVMWLFHDMLHSTKPTNFSQMYFFFNIDKMALRDGWNGFEGRIWSAGRILETLAKALLCNSVELCNVHPMLKHQVWSEW